MVLEMIPRIRGRVAPWSSCCLIFSSLAGCILVIIIQISKNIHHLKKWILQTPNPNRVNFGDSLYKEAIAVKQFWPEFGQMIPPPHKKKMIHLVHLCWWGPCSLCPHACKPGHLPLNYITFIIFSGFRIFFKNL